MPIVQPSGQVEGHSFKKLFNKLNGQPASYAQKSKYVFGRTLGAGSFGLVRQARNVETKEEVAVKIVLKKALRGNEDSFYQELEFLQKCRHPHIVGFRDWFESKDKFYIVTQLATGGELFNRIVAEGKFTEEDATKVIAQVLSAVRYLHDELNIVHRDLKPENLLYVSEDPNSPLVLADFGIAKQLLTPDEVLTSAAGSLGYCAPEVLTGHGHGKPCDIWSLGIITYTLLAGYSPFRAENPSDFLQEVRNDPPVVFHREFWRNISDAAKDFILQATKLDPKKRATAKELSSHPWLNSEANKYGTVDLAPQIKKFNAKQKFKQAVEIVKLNNRINNLRDLEGSDGDSDFPLVDTTDSASTSGSSVSSSAYDLSSLSGSLKSASSNKSPKSPRASMSADLFHQVVKAATSNKEKVLNYRDTKEENN